jgi:hypothetical protein
MEYRMVKNRFKFNVSTFSVAILAVLLIGTAPSQAASPTTSACVNVKTSGIRILINGTCKAKVEKKVVFYTATPATPTLPSIWLSP